MPVIDLTDEEFLLTQIAVATAVERAKEYVATVPAIDVATEERGLEDFMNLQEKFPEPVNIIRTYS